MKLSTIGFTKKSAPRFFSLLRNSGVKRVVDVRINNGSQLAGFAKKNDLAYFLDEICGIDYIHLPDIAPTKELLREYRSGTMDWKAYEPRFIELMRDRRIEETTPKDVIDDGCLLCSEDQPHHRHRRLVAEYLKITGAALRSPIYDKSGIQICFCNYPFLTVPVCMDCINQGEIRFH